MKKFTLLLIAIPGVLSFLSSCNDSQELEDPCPSAIEVTSVETLDAVIDESNGRIQVNASSRNGSTTYSIDGQNYQSSSVFSGLQSGTYTVYVKDELNCEIQVTAAIDEMLPVSYVMDIVPILENNCMISGCHCDGNSLCWDDYDLISSYADEIRQRTTDGNMPPAYSGKFLTEVEKQLIADWVTQGAPEN